jgi:hypothetical protein
MFFEEYFLEKDLKKIETLPQNLHRSGNGHKLQEMLMEIETLAAVEFAKILI